MSDAGEAMSRTVLVPAARVRRWFDNFGERHGAATYSVEGGLLAATAPDGARARAALPFGRSYDGAADPENFGAAVDEPSTWGVLLVRKGGFAIARVDGGRVVESKVGRRHVQGRTKAGGQSQQRFARRRENQARVAYEAATDHAVRILTSSGAALDALVCGGDRTAVDAVLADPRLSGPAAVRVEPWLPLPDPRAEELRRAVEQGSAARIEVVDPPEVG